MKIHCTNNGVALIGKAWEIREFLKQKKKQFYLVEEWHRSLSNNQHTAAATPKKNKGSLSIVRPIVDKGNGDKF
ncbi:Z-ring formation inhibitor MciZ [Bacillus alkalicola]|uniref:Z-ring formation inhibitor MciZ n=1 Tax=Evansella alkalicola TaxID=745819 RepID=A0ABS6JZN1_9BACI|nr:Z-ring formation inhibitor MciZ [Bacillus alkalicola]